MLTNVQAHQERVDPRIKRTRQLLMRSFSELLGEKSFEAITVQDITDRATVNRATFYAHFQDKYDLLEQSVSERFQEALHQKLPPGSQFSSTNLQVLIQTVCEFLGDLHSHCAPSARNQFDSLIEQMVKAHMYRALLDWFERSAFKGTHSQDEAELRATVANWGIYGAALRWSQDGRGKTVESFSGQVLPLITAVLQGSPDMKVPRGNK